MFWMVAAMVTTAGLFRHRVSFPKTGTKTKGSFSTIIPARNEEDNLKRLLPTLAESGEVIVVDDNSEDETAEVAERSGARVIRAPELPEGWMGKSWACHNGAKEASGETLIFLDADTWMEEEGTERIVRYVEDHDSLITVHPYHVMKSFPEKLSAVFHSVVYASTGITALGTKKGSSLGGFGPCLALPASLYRNLGGHEAIRGEVTEHLAFSRKAAEQGIPVKAFSGRGVLSMRMYPASFRAVTAGWAKSFASGAASASPWMTIWNVAWISSVFSFLARIPDIGWPSVIGYTFLSGWLARFWKDIGNFHIGDALLFPVHFLFFISLFTYSLASTFLLKQTTWKGRVIT
ncbi:glycosyltransferase [Salimicrobium halophilum]|uniref:4,4'-diaponeurosporenoate glycosyltransferase n=1 Tax=Salimicrobium halophilum TaxID=86666 RepID=A0A1G8R4K2_9BACI|nr:glycosyltransferase family 2 protein [Salimicrobium halophilum]SDJ11515.1 4,4'-diaponeurosporenoate glycosyltransferase [Salimicrobium halophilum]